VTKHQQHLPCPFVLTDADNPKKMNHGSSEKPANQELLLKRTSDNAKPAILCGSCKQKQ